jgi:hypothetical protein
MSITDDLKYLSQFKEFGRFLLCVRDFREAQIGELHKADTAQIQQIAGQIGAYDSILRLTNADDVIARLERLP